MASPPTTEASEVRRRGRQRLIGAIALVAILVVFVPMLLDSEPRPERADPTIPPKTNAPPLPAPPPKVEAKTSAPSVTSTSSVTPAQGGAPSAAPTPATATVEPAKAPPATPAKVDVKAASATPPKAQPPTAPRLEGFAVQVGAFRDEAKLDQARQKLAAAKVAHYTERLEAKGGPLTRLRAGPFPTREAAESALVTVKRSALEGKVVPLP